MEIISCYAGRFDNVVVYGRPSEFCVTETLRISERYLRLYGRPTVEWTRCDPVGSGCITTDRAHRKYYCSHENKGQVGFLPAIPKLNVTMESETPTHEATPSLGILLSMYDSWLQVQIRLEDKPGTVVNLSEFDAKYLTEVIPMSELSREAYYVRRLVSTIGTTVVLSLSKNGGKLVTTREYKVKVTTEIGDVVIKRPAPYSWEMEQNLRNLLLRGYNPESPRAQVCPPIGTNAARKTHNSFKFEPNKLTGTKWEGTIQLSSIKPNFEISLPGHFTSVYIKSMGHLATTEGSVKIYSIENTKFKEYKGKKPENCSREINTNIVLRECLNFTSTIPGKSFIMFVIHLESDCCVANNVFLGMPFFKYRIFPVSWNEASRLCKTVDGYLPILRSKEELDELISLMKLPEHISPTSLLHIGLRENISRTVSSI